MTYSRLRRGVRHSAARLMFLGLMAARPHGLMVPSFQAGSTPLPQAGLAPSADVDRWESAIETFEDHDKVGPPPQHAIVFVGASSIVRWNLARSFPELGPKAINRGFGGSLLPDSTRQADRIVMPYHPQIVVLYAGDNDIEAHHTPEQIAADFERFDQKVHGSLPQTHIIFISIKPSIRRWAFMAQIRAANALLNAYCATHPKLTYLDIVQPMLGADGMPRKDLLAEDGLHMTSAGYTIWSAALRPLLRLETTGMAHARLSQKSPLNRQW
jgi:lysophospholipase L1-like esterase